jgi:YfiH family protein
MAGRSSWQIEERGDVPLCTSAWLASQPGLVHAFTRRGYNMSLHAGPHFESSGRRRRDLCEILGLDFDRLTAARQIHGAEVVPVDRTLAGAGRDASAPAIPHVDGMVTVEPGVALLGMSADCPLVVLFDPRTPALGIAHAGWRGTLAGIAGRLVQQMQRACGSRPEHLFGAIGPCAGADQYEVQQDVIRLAAARWDEHGRYFHARDGRSYFDLRAANIDQLRACGVSSDQIDIASFCTIQDERFYSYRRDGAATGHAALVVGLV